ncbi:MAG: HAD hydrolase family protein [Phycisphaerales bacterium]|nr:HAD hydrolase family protein [Phycisphaerales bacterium]
MRIYLTGITGVVGHRLACRLAEAGDDIVAVTRNPHALQGVPGLERVGVLEGDPTCPGSWQQAIDGAEVVVHLAGSGTAADDLTAEGIEATRARRVDSTFQVAMGIEDAAMRPHRLVMLSNRLAVAKVEGGIPVSTMIRAWEDQALQLTSLGVEVLALRSGWLLGPDAGCLDSIARAKPGNHPVGWIHVDDLVACLERAVRGDLVGVHDVIAPDRPLLQDVITIAASHAHVGSGGGVGGGGGESTALVEWPLPFEADGNDDRLGHDFRFPNFDEAVRDICKNGDAVEQPRKSAPIRPAAPARRGRTPGSRHLVVLPCEGLLMADDVLHPDSPDWINSLHAAGLLVVVATSRGGGLPLGIARQLGLAAPVIAADGSVLVDPVRQEAIRTELLSAERVGGITMAVRTAEPRLQVVVERGLRVSTDSEAELPEMLRNLVTVDEVVDSGALLSRPATRLLLHAPARRLGRALRVVRETWWRDRIVAIHEHEPGTVAITSVTADRGVALQRIESALGIERKGSIVVAAGDRDLGLLQFAGIGCALPDVHAGDEAIADHALPADPAEVIEAVLRIHRDRLPRSAPASGR